MGVWKKKNILEHEGGRGISIERFEYPVITNK